MNAPTLATRQGPGDAAAVGDEGGGSTLMLLDAVVELARHWKLLLLTPLLLGSLGLGASYMMTPVFSARTSVLVPQQQPSGAAAALASLGSVAGLAGGVTGIRSPLDQYVALMQSETVVDRLIDRFELMKVYQDKLRLDTRRKLAGNSRIAAGKKDGLISIEVDDIAPQRAAAIATQYVEELRRLTSTLAITEAQQRRVFFETQLKKSRDELTQAQRSLQGSGFTPGALRAEPRAAAEEYARSKAEVTAAEVRVQTLRERLADGAAEVRQAVAALAALRGQLARLEAAAAGPAEGSADYVGRYREFKYQEALFEMFSRQYELARLDESREGALIQVVDPAQVPEWKSRPRRATIAAISALAGLVATVFFVLARRGLRNAARDPAVADRLKTLSGAWRRR